MAVYEQVFCVICEKCYKDFIKPFRIYTVTNVDYKSNISSKLLSDNLNKITCPECGTVFTYERPHLAYSLAKGYAIYAGCKPDIRRRISGRKRMYDMMGCIDMRFRQVDFLCEVSEKIRIFENNLNDISIEKVKLAHFGDEYFADKTNNILLFKDIDSDDMIFEYVDYLGNVLETHKIPLCKYPSADSAKEPEAFENGFVVWTKIDNNYIKEISND